MIDFKHFENLWEECEKLHENEVYPDIDELIMKIGLYQSFSKRTNLSNDDLQKIKSRLMGEILFFLTALSLKDNINVYKSLLETYLEKIK